MYWQRFNVNKKESPQTWDLSGSQVTSLSFFTVYWVTMKKIAEEDNKRVLPYKLDGMLHGETPPTYP